MVVTVKLLFTTILCWLYFRAKFDCNSIQSFFPCIYVGFLLYGLCVRESVKSQAYIEDQVDSRQAHEKLTHEVAMC